MILFLTESNNQEANIFFNHINILKSQQICVVTIEELLFHSKLQLVINDVESKFVLKLQNSIELHSDSILHCFNFVANLSHLYFGKFIKEDKEYISQEWHSILLSMLHILKNKMVFNHAAPFALNGETFTKEEFILMANKAGFTTPIYYANHVGSKGFHIEEGQSSTITLVVFEGLIFGHEQVLTLLPVWIHEAIKKLLSISGQNILEISIFITPKTIYFLDAATLPSIYSFTESFYNHLNHKLNN